MASISSPISRLPCTSMNIIDRRMQSMRRNSSPSSVPLFSKSTVAANRKSLAYSRPRCATTSNLETGPEDGNRVTDPVARLHAALKSNNYADLSELVGDDCRCGVKFASVLLPFGDKKQVLAVLMYLIKRWGSGISIFVQPMSKEGVAVGLQWKLEWKKSSAPLGNGLILQTSHAYRGRVLIRNVEILVQPLSYLEPFRQRAAEFLTVAVGRIRCLLPEPRKKITLYVVGIIATLMFALKLLLH
uniref:Uncharacterized protein n=1 Tax=Kalanchoe fedtschenkoi TaxID=63787 RepID=A0A7N0ZWP2_KALFE